MFRGEFMTLQCIKIAAQQANPVLVGIFVILMGLVSQGCERKRSGESFLLECKIGADQGRTISGSWEVRPIPIAFRVTNSSSSNFTPSEMTEVLNAARTWNQFFEVSMGFPIFDIGPSGNPYTTTEPLVPDVCNGATMISGNNFVREMIIEKRTSGWTTAQEDVLAITDFCSPGGIMRFAQLRFNYQFFHNAGQRDPDLESLALHELGHVMGLNHSCQAGQAGEGFPSCGAFPSSHEYIQAVLFPGLNFINGVGQIRRALQDNDMGRANCAYKAES